MPRAITITCQRTTGQCVIQGDKDASRQFTLTLMVATIGKNNLNALQTFCDPDTSVYLEEKPATQPSQQPTQSTTFNLG